MARRLLWATLLLAASNACAQNSETPVDQAVSTFRVDARSVVVDVVVTDRSGHAVSGLRKAQFQILEDGKPQAINGFDEQAATPSPQVSGLPASASASSAPAANPLPANTFSNAPAAVLTDSINILLLDSLNTPMADQAYVRKQMIKFLATIPAGTRLGVFTLSERLRMVQGITTDTALLQKAIASSAANPSHSALLANPEETAVNHNAVGSLASAGGGNSQMEAASNALQAFLNQQAAFATSQRLAYTLDAFEQIARYLAGVPGRKNLVWFSGSFPLCVSENDCPNKAQVDRTIELLEEAQVAIYPIDASGLAPDAINDASAPPNHDLDLNLRHGAAAGQVATAAQVTSLSEGSTTRAGNQDTMETLAKGTGGEAAYNTNDFLGAFTRDLEHGARYYTLTYTPPQHTRDGASHAITVRVDPAKYKLAYRRSYLDRPGAPPVDQQAADDPLRHLMLQGMPDFTQLLYRANISPVATAPDTLRAGDNPSLSLPVTRYRVQFALALDGLAWETISGAGHGGSLEAALVAYSREGKPLNWETRTLTLNLTPQQFEIARHSGIPLQFDLDAPRGAVFLRTGIFDLTSRRAGTIEISLDSITTRPEAADHAEAARYPEDAKPAASALPTNPAEISSPSSIAVAAPEAVTRSRPNPVPATVVRPLQKQASIAYWSLPPKQVTSMLVSAPDSDSDRYLRLRTYFKHFGCDSSQMEEMPPIGRQHNLICSLPGSASDQIVITAHYERPQNADARDQNWEQAVLLAMLFKALQAETRNHTFVFVELCGDDGEKQFLDHLTRGPRQVPAAVIALDLRKSGSLFYEFSWNAALLMQQHSSTSIASGRLESLRAAEDKKALLASTLARTAQISREDLPREQKAPRTIENSWLFLRSTDIASILIYAAAPPHVSTSQPGATSRFDLLSPYLCALDTNLRLPSATVR